MILKITELWQGDFKDGYPTGKGMMILSDLSYYKGEFCKGLFHGEGVFCISNTPMIYSGSWKGGRKHGEHSFIIETVTKSYHIQVKDGYSMLLVTGTKENGMKINVKVLD